MRHITIAWKLFRLINFWIWNHWKSDFEERFSLRIKKAIESLGGGFLKIGQIMSMRHDLLPEHYCDQLRNCLDSAQPIPPHLGEKILAPIMSHFQELSKDPIASASVAQVHEGILNSGEHVAVKILRPGIRRTMKQDAFWWKIIGRSSKRFYPKVDPKDWKALVDFVAHQIVQETDLRNELKNMKVMRRKYPLDKISIPKTYEKFCSNRILVMEFFEGENLNQKMLTSNKEEKTLLAEKLCELFRIHTRESILNGFFHGDLHPANIIFLENGTIGLLDFGSIGYYPKSVRKGLLLYLLGTVLYDPEIAAEGARIVSSQYAPETFDMDRYRARATEVMDWFKDAPYEEMTTTQFLLIGISATMEQGALFDPVVSIYSRSSCSIDGALRTLSPHIIWPKQLQAFMIQTYMEFKMQDIGSPSHIILNIEKLWHIVERSPEKVRDMFEKFFEKQKTSA